MILFLCIMEHMKDKIYAACIGLAKTSINNGKTNHTDQLIYDALHSNDFNEKVLNELHQEKDILQPGCKTCISHCGETDDVLPELKEGTYKKKVFDLALKSDNLELITEALARVGYNMDDDTYINICERLEKTIQ